MTKFVAGDFVRSANGQVWRICEYHKEHEFLVIVESPVNGGKACFLESGLAKVRDFRRLSVGDQIELELRAKIIEEDVETASYLVELYSLLGAHVHTGWMSSNSLSDVAVEY